jgi:putative ABC transport system substrate-binding protein
MTRVVALILVVLSLIGCGRGGVRHRVRLDSPAAVPIEVPMRLIGLAVVVTLGLLIAPLAVEAQQAAKVYRIGYLTPRSGIEPREEAFRQALRQLGYVEGQNLVIEWRFAKGRPGVYRELVAELVRLKLDCILVTGVGPVAALKNATATIPIVIGTIDADPVEEGLVASFARPGGNITGMTGIAYELAGKRLALLKETVPRLSRAGILVNPSPAADAHVKMAVAAAGNLGIELHVVEVRSPGSGNGIPSRTPEAG